MELGDLRVAIVHDDFIQQGGAEKLVLAMLELFPQADLFSVVAIKHWRRVIRKQSNKVIRTSWLQRFPFKEKFFRYYYTFYPLAVESWRFDDYDLVISSSARYAHGVLTKPQTVHIAYVNSPARFLWEEDLIPRNPLLKLAVNWHRAWDKVAAQRPDYLVANSKTPAERIRRYWGREVDAVIYPFVNVERFERPSLIGLDPKGSNPWEDKEYFLVVSRLKRWKRIDLAIEACNRLRLPLVVVGRGEDGHRLKTLAGPTVKFLDRVADDQLVSLYQNCRAFLQTQEEDFGITSLEAQAAGRPVIALGCGGALETIRAGITGLYFGPQSVEGLIKALSQFDEKNYLRENCQEQAQRFSKESFQTNFKDFIFHALRSN